MDSSEMGRICQKSDGFVRNDLTDLSVNGTDLSDLSVSPTDLSDLSCALTDLSDILTDLSEILTDLSDYLTDLSGAGRPDTSGAGRCCANRSGFVTQGIGTLTGGGG